MKPNQILTCSIAILGLSQFASADLTIHLTGSSAFRAAVVTAIRNKMTFTNPGEGYGYDGTNFTKATYHYFKGQFPSVASAGTVTIKTNWSGSVEGIRDVSVPNSISYIADGTTVSSAGTTGLTATASEAPEIAMADNRQTSTIYKTPVLNVKNAVGIVPFAFVASKSVPSVVTNITPQLVDGLLSEGRLPVSEWTGNPTDATKYIYSTGRNPGSGTRLTALAESKHGTINVVKQFRPTGGTLPANSQITSVELFPANPPDVPDVGNDGYSSGGSVSDILRNDTSAAVTDTQNNTTIPANSFAFASYVGESDSYGAVFGAPFTTTPTGANAGNAHYLTYNGISAFASVAKKPGSSLLVADQPTYTSGSPVITLKNSGAANDSSGLVVGQIVSGTGIAPGSTILSVDTTTQITLDKNATANNPALASTNLQIGALLPKAIRNGQYTFWNYEFALWKSSVIGTSGDKLNVANAIVTEVTSNTFSLSGLSDEGISPLTESSFRVQRGNDGGYVYPK